MSKHSSPAANYALILIQETRTLLDGLALEARTVVRNSLDDVQICAHVQHIKQHVAEARLIASKTCQVEPTSERVFCCNCDEDISNCSESERYFNACANCLELMDTEPEALLQRLLS